MTSSKPFINSLSALKPLWSFVWRLLAILVVARCLLVGWQWDRVSAADMLLPVFVQGLRFDLVLAGLLLAPIVLLFPLLMATRFTIASWRILLAVYFPLALAAILFMEFSTPSFVNQFDSRPNILFVEYLDHPREVMSTLWAAYKWQLTVAVVAVCGFAVLTFRRFRWITRGIQPVGIVPILVLTPLLLLACFAMIRSTTDHRPVNPSTVALSNDPLANDLALNSTYTVLYAIYETRHEAAGGFRYADVEQGRVITDVRNAMDVVMAEFTSESLPTLHRQPGNAAAPAQNLVIIIEESLGAEFVGALGGLDLTPNIDALAGEGIWFENLYATGTRSARGLEAIVSGFTPTPARSVVKLPKSQRGFFTLAGLLGLEGYETSFIYGGEAQFDNMRRFFVNNGFQRVVDEKDYENPVFTGSWGVSDEDLFERAHEEFESAGNRPFFSVVFTSSNHSPYQFPDDRIELYDSEKNTVNNAVKYADYALGRFFQRAKDSSYWDNTVFLVVADHNSRVYGSEVVPVDRFHIPGLILGGSIEAGVFAPVASQIDLGPTLLSMIGVSTEHPMIGHDLTRESASLLPGRAILQFNGTQAYMQGDEVVILQKDLPARTMRYRDGHLVDSEFENDALIHRALSHAAWSSMAYELALYRLPQRPDRI